jgi:hypothetical protein
VIELVGIISPHAIVCPVPPIAPTVHTVDDDLDSSVVDEGDVAADVGPRGPSDRELNASIAQALSDFLADGRSDNLFIQVADGDEYVDFVKVPLDAGLTMYLTLENFDADQTTTIAELVSGQAGFGGTRRFFDDDYCLVDFGSNVTAAASALLQVFREVYGFRGPFALTTDARMIGFDPQARVFRRAPAGRR